MQDGEVDGLGREILRVSVQCPVCQKKEVIVLVKEQYDLWKAGAFIQDAFPELDPDVREQLITGTCGTCWDRMWKEEEE